MKTLILAKGSGFSIGAGSAINPLPRPVAGDVLSQKQAWRGIAGAQFLQNLVLAAADATAPGITRRGVVLIRANLVVSIALFF
jgi:hypothetical protein